MASPQAIESLKNLFISHSRGDEASFGKAAETIIRQLTLENRPSEAKYLRDVLAGAKPSESNGKSLMPLQRPGSPLISFVPVKDDHRLFFDPETEKALQGIVAEHRSREKLAQGGLFPKSKLLFWGPPGCGKTAAAFWLGSQLGLQVGVVRLGALITSYVGETGSNLQKIFAAAEQNPMVLLLDEADAVAKARGDENDVGELRRVVNALLQGLDFFSPRRSVAILATNHAFLFDTAIWRRFDDVVAFPLPKDEQRLGLLKHLTSGLKIKGSLSSVSRKLTGHSFAEINRSVLQTAKNKVLSDAESVDAAEILSEARAWRHKTNAALAKPPRGR